MAGYTYQGQRPTKPRGKKPPSKPKAKKPAPIPRTPRPLQPCGTWAAYVRHVYRGEDACEPCLEAGRLRTRLRNPRANQLKPCGTYAAYKRHQRRNEEPCGPCAEAYSQYNQDRWARARTTQGARP